MNGFVRGVMYLLWILSILFILAATFMDFKYEDLNILAAVFLVFTLLNTFFLWQRKPKTH